MTEWMKERTNELHKERTNEITNEPHTQRKTYIKKHTN